MVALDSESPLINQCGFFAEIAIIRTVHKGSRDARDWGSGHRHSAYSSVEE